MTKLEALRSKIAAVTMEEIRIAVIEDEITLLQSRLEPHDTGHLHTAISVLAHRLVELKKTNLPKQHFQKQDQILIDLKILVTQE